MIGKYKNYILLALIALLSTIVLWSPFFLRLDSVWGVNLPKDGMATVVANFDGPYYIVAAKTLYDPAKIDQIFPFSLPPIYYTSSYPLFPGLIRGLATIMPFLGYTYSMILITLISGILAILMFYTLLNNVGLKKQSFWLATIFTVFPARWFVVRSIGSPEPLFLLFILVSIYFFKNQRWWLAGIFGALAQLTKSPGILLFIGYVAALVIPYWKSLATINTGDWIKKLHWKAYPILLIPLTLVAVFAFYGVMYGNFLAYFNSGDNIHLKFPPFQVFSPGQTWVGTFWTEEIIWLYLFGAMGLAYLIKQGRSIMASFVGVFFFFILFVAHRDISRYALPIAPFILVAFSDVLSSKEFKIVAVLLVIPIFLYSIAFIANNVTPISDWGPLL